MTRPIDLLRQGRKEELWQMCCGFVDLSLEQFMAIQKRLLLEQIEFLKSSELGRKIMGGAVPETIEEFREQVPLTTYDDYLPELEQKREDVLPARVAYWTRTSGYTSKYDVKWVPLSEGFSAELEKVCAGLAILALCNDRGDASRLKEHFKILFTLGFPPYASGILGQILQQAIGFDFLPSNKESMPFTEMIKAGFEEALYRGLDGFGGICAVLVSVGEQLKQQSGNINTRRLLKHPRAFSRVMRALVQSKRGHRPILPKDLWSIKGIIGGGTDSAIFRKKVEHLWGRTPLEIYASAEGSIYATQTWDYEGMVFIPSLNFFEFIPEREWFKWQLDHSYQPEAVLLDEVKAGEVYEMVITNFHGGIMTRCRLGDMVRITSLRNEKLNIDIPQMAFDRRADDLIDISGFGRLTEKIIWEAIENTGLPYNDWTVRKEMYSDRAVLHIYLELRDEYIASEQGMAGSIYEELGKLDGKYHWKVYDMWGNTTDVLGLKPVEVTILPKGAFSNYISQRQAEGADLGHLKPPHVNPSDAVLSQLGAPEVMVKAVSVPEEAERITSR